MFAIYKRELYSYFSSPVGYVVVAAFMAFSGIFFYVQCLFAGTSNMYQVFQSMFFIVLFIIPLITMRSFAEDRKNKTDQALLTSPVSIPSIVTAKFASAFTVLAICLSSYIIEGIILSTIASPDWSVIIGNVLGMLLMGSAFIAIGIFISSLTENTIIAAVFAFMANVMISMVDSISSTVSWAPVKSLLSMISFQTKYRNFALGLISLSDVVFFVSITLLFLFFTDRITDRRRWA
ncbi:MAG: ABC transporter permease subunit [Clostridia bacterium]|nr:ABC transporter permease subunit [Clostridia bacterium]